MKAKGVREMRAEYDFDYSKAARGKYHRHVVTKDSNVVVLDPDVAKVFKDSGAVNKALRTLLKISEDTKRLTAKPRPR